MRKLFLLLFLTLAPLVCSAYAQSDGLKEREAQWKTYALPQVPFARYTSAEKEFIVRVPSDWKQTGTQLLFTAPFSSTFHISVEKVPDGIPLTDYVAVMMRTFDGLMGYDISPVIRRTQLQDLEAREISFESPNDEGELTNTAIWVTVKGPHAIAFTFQTPAAHTHELEPFFKEIVQSVMFVDAFTFEPFEKKRKAVQSAGGASINEIQLLAASLEEAISGRDAVIENLSQLVSSNPGVVIDLLLDRRPLVRAAAVEALARTKNPWVDQFLWDAVEDVEPLVAQPAARRLAANSDVLTKLLDHSIVGLEFEVVGRIWPFLTKDKQLELMRRIFSHPAIKPETPSPPIRRLKPGVSVTVKELIAVVPGAEIQYLEDPNVQLGALTLLGDLSVEEFKLPLTTLLAAEYDPLTIVGLQVANNRHEQLPLDPLLKLATSQNSDLRDAALLSLAYSAKPADVPRIEAIGTKDTEQRIKLTIKKIRLLDQLASAKHAAQPTTTILKTALSDPELAEFAWQQTDDAHIQSSQFAHSPTSNQSNISSSGERDLVIKPMGANLFPRRVTHFAAIPNPSQTVNRFYESLRGIQMDSARAQSSLVLTMGGSRQLLGQLLSAPPNAESLIDYTGIKPDAPIGLAQWTPESSPSGLSAAKRRAIVLQIEDRARFLRTIAIVQKTGGDFASLTDYIAAGTRMLPALPAFLPFTAKQIVSSKPAKPESRSMLKYSVIAETKFNGRPITVIQNRALDSSWKIDNSSSYLLFVGNDAIVSNDLATIQELVARAESDSSENLSLNENFRNVLADGGEVVYFSDLEKVFAEVGGTAEDHSGNPTESGSLRILASSWENSHRFTFAESDWSKYFQTFHPKDLSAPRDVLPNSTIAYFFIKPDTLNGLQRWSKDLFNLNKLEPETSLLALDFTREVVPELGPECGIAILDLPDWDDFTNLKWAAFCKLKTNKLTDALHSGHLFRDVGPTEDVAEVKSEKKWYFVSSKKGFLIVSNFKGLQYPDTVKSSLASTRDYSKAVETVPDGILAFGGYNLEAAVAAAESALGDGLNAQIAGVVFSLAGAFHSQSFYATGTAHDISAKSSVAMDREGRYAIADLSFLSRGKNITFATLEPHGVPILDQSRISSLVMKVSSKSTGPIENIRDDIKTPDQSVELRSPNELILTIAPRRSGTEQKIQLPITDANLAQFLLSSTEFPADNKDVIQQAKNIAGEDKDAWSVAKKLADWTFKNLTWKATAVANPSQTLATREADCSEFSALYVSMARALGLPARIVSGLAYGGGSFGGHAWVEVWVGRWVELDPTWGTDFVDATHIRNTSSTLVTSAALNLLDFEVLEIKRKPADFQKSAQALAVELKNAFNTGRQSSFEASTDVEILTEHFMGPDRWSSLSNDERERLQLGQRRALLQLYFDHRGNDWGRTQYRLIHLSENGNRAEALLISSGDDLLKVSLINKRNNWYLVDIANTDTGVHVIGDALTPIIKTIEEKRAGGNTPTVVGSELRRALLLAPSNPKKAMAILDAALKKDPKNRELRLLKAQTLIGEKDRDQGVALLKELSNETPVYAPAVFKLAKSSRASEKEQEKKSALDQFTEYIALEPNDPRGHEWIAYIYVDMKELDKAEAELQKTLDLDPDNFDHYFNFIEFLIEHERIDRVARVLDYGKNHPDAGEDLFGSVVESLYFDDEGQLAEKLVASQPARIKTSLLANLTLARIRIDNSRPVEALPLLNLAVRLDNKSIEAYLVRADAYHALARWPAALRAVDAAIKLEDKNSVAHYERARILARMGRTFDAIAELKRSVELDSERLILIGDEKDFRALRALPTFKEMVAESEKTKKERQKSTTPAQP